MTVATKVVPRSEENEVFERLAADTNTARPTAFVFYHYFPPDEVVSAIHIGGFSAGLAARGWAVTAFPCVWGCRDDSTRFEASEQWRKVSVRRIWRPKFRQSSGSGRILNALWMIVRWSLLALRRRSPDVVVIGTDPILSILVARVWKFFHPRTKIVHWCFDLYPEAAIAEGLVDARSFPVRLLDRLLRPAYSACSLIADLGPCMRGLLTTYHSAARRETLVPWAIDEPELPLPPDPEQRERVFGKVRLALLYSGNFGLAHSYQEILDLADTLPHEIKVAFSVGGNRKAELQEAVKQRNLDSPFVPFAQTSELRARLACADVHIVTLREEWTGMVVPSKFFGALSAGRPVLFAGSSNSSLAQWIREFQIGWTLNSRNIQEVKEQLIRYADSPALRAEMQIQCFSVYRQHFSRATQMDRWNEILRELLR